MISAHHPGFWSRDKIIPGCAPWLAAYHSLAGAYESRPFPYEEMVFSYEQKLFREEKMIFSGEARRA